MNPQSEPSPEFDAWWQFQSGGRNFHPSCRLSAWNDKLRRDAELATVREYFGAGVAEVGRMNDKLYKIVDDDGKDVSRELFTSEVDANLELRYQEIMRSCEGTLVVVPAVEKCDTSST